MSTPPANTEGSPAGATGRTSYQVLLVALLSLNFGVVFFDRNALNFMMPFIQPELHLSNTRVGALAAALALSWALSGLFLGRISDVLGKRKVILVVCTVVFSCASLLSGIAVSFAFLLGARLIMGMAEGGVLPISQTLIAAEVHPARRGLAMGVTQNFGAALLGNFLGPVVVVAVATAVGWRSACYLTAAPGLLMAALIGLLVIEPAPAKVAQAAPRKRDMLREVFVHRNVIVCTVMSVLLVAFLMVFYSFMPLVLITVRGFDRSTMSWLMATYGLSSIAYAVLVPGASDLVGRRPVTVIVAAVSTILPLAALFSNGPVWQLFGLFALGSVISGIFPICMATIPAETVPPRLIATVMGVTMGAAEILGGVFGPVVTGMIADHYGLRATLWVLVSLTIAMSLLALALTETAPALPSPLRRSLGA
jgi:ACS family hexuronate transporter-like MFS transporter